MNVAYIKSKITRLQSDVVKCEKECQERMSEEGISPFMVNVLAFVFLEEYTILTQELRYWEQQLAEATGEKTTDGKNKLLLQSVHNSIRQTVHEEVQGYANNIQINTSILLPIRF